MCDQFRDLGVSLCNWNFRLNKCFKIWVFNIYNPFSSVRLSMGNKWTTPALYNETTQSSTLVSSSGHANRVISWFHLIRVHGWCSANDINTGKTEQVKRADKQWYDKWLPNNNNQTIYQSNSIIKCILINISSLFDVHNILSQNSKKILLKWDYLIADNLSYSPTTDSSLFHGHLFLLIIPSADHNNVCRMQACNSAEINQPWNSTMRNRMRIS